jgi:acyl dehydratase
METGGWIGKRNMVETAGKVLAVGSHLFRETFAPITRHRLALYCAGSGDHNPIHVDIDFAKASGYDDVFVHGMLVMAYLGSALTHALPQSMLRSFNVRFVAVTPLLASITCEGTVSGVVEKLDERLLQVSLTARDGYEIKLSGDALVLLDPMHSASRG